MRRRLFLASVALSACLSPVVNELPLDAGAQDLGFADAGSFDAGSSDAGVGDAGRWIWLDVDAGELDAGSFDAGIADAGAPDAGKPDAGPGFDAGQCTNMPLVPLNEFANSPRADRWTELLVLHADPAHFSVDDATYARAVSERALIESWDAGPFRFVPSWGEAFGLKLDMAGVAELRAGTYTAWDCLNWTYRGTPAVTEFTPGPDGYLYVNFEPVISLPKLAAEYSALPHVEVAFQNSFGVFATCGYASDGCLAIDGSTWRWIWYVESRTCAREWHRMQTEEDGGVTFETANDGGVPNSWFDDVPSCWDQLWATQFRSRDGGP